MDSFTQSTNGPQGEPQYGQQYGQPAPATPNKKSQYGLISVIVGLLCVVIAFVGIVKTTNGSLFDIPVLGMVSNLSGEDMEAEYDEIIDRMEDDVDEFSDDELEEIEDTIGMTAEDLVDEMRTPSINSLVKIAEKIKDADIDTISDEDIDIFKTVRSVLTGYGVVIMLFALLAALLKNRVLSIIGLIVSIPFFLGLAGFIFMILYAVATVAHVVLVSKHKKAVRGY